MISMVAPIVRASSRRASSMSDMSEMQTRRATRDRGPRSDRRLRAASPEFEPDELGVRG